MKQGDRERVDGVLSGPWLFHSEGGPREEFETRLLTVKSVQFQFVQEVLRIVGERVNRMLRKIKYRTLRA